MSLPSKHSNTGRVLRAMYCSGPMPAGNIRRKAQFSTDTEITARIRDIRKLGWPLKTCVAPLAGITDPKWGEWVGERINAVRGLTE